MVLCVGGFCVFGFFLFVLNNQIQLSSGESRLEVDSVKISDGSCKVFVSFRGIRETPGRENIFL